jgi:hypothetical protein
VRRTHRPRLWRNSSRRQIQPGVQTMYEPAPEVSADLLAAADELDALETGLVADVELHPGESATHQVDELLAVLDAELGEDAINVSLHRPHRDRKPLGDLTVG